jgi:serine/threonine-protein kinase
LPDVLQNPEAVARLISEARAAVRIKSEHVARVTDVGVFDDGAPFMVME